MCYENGYDDVNGDDLEKKSLCKVEDGGSAVVLQLSTLYTRVNIIYIYIHKKVKTC